MGGSFVVQPIEPSAVRPRARLLELVVELLQALPIGAHRLRVDVLAGVALDEHASFVAGRAEHVQLFVGTRHQPLEQHQPARVLDANGALVEAHRPDVAFAPHRQRRVRARHRRRHDLAFTVGEPDQPGHAEASGERVRLLAQRRRFGDAAGTRLHARQLVGDARDPGRVAAGAHARQRFAELALGGFELAERRVQQAAHAHDRTFVRDRQMAGDDVPARIDGADVEEMANVVRLPGEGERLRRQRPEGDVVSEHHAVDGDVAQRRGGFVPVLEPRLEARVEDGGDDRALGQARPDPRHDRAVLAHRRLVVEQARPHHPVRAQRRRQRR